MKDLEILNAKLKFISRLSKTQRLIIMAYENLCNNLKNVSQSKVADNETFQKSIELILNNSHQLIREHELKSSYLEEMDGNGMSEGSNDFCTDTSSQFSSEETSNSDDISDIERIHP